MSNKRHTTATTSLLARQEILARFFDEMSDRYFTAEGDWERPYGVCTYLNSAMVAALRNEGRACALYGADERIMATAEKWTRHGGHDWLLVDGRYVVDLWVPAYVNPDETCVVWDLEARRNPYLPDEVMWTALDMDAFEPWIREAAEDWSAFMQTLDNASSD